MAKKRETTKAHCNTCLRENQHLVLATRERSLKAPIDESPFAEESYEIWWRNTYEMLECCGCESITLRHTYEFSEWDGLEINYYPPKISRKIPNWQEKLTKPMQLLLKEIYDALGTDSSALAMMGARALIDLVIVDRVGDVGTFAQKLAAMERKGYLSASNSKYLNAAIEVGNASAHRGHRPDDADVSRVIDIMENLLESIYILEPAADELAKKTPPRKPKT